jgi:hypothetical protein
LASLSLARFIKSGLENKSQELERNCVGGWPKLANPFSDKEVLLGGHFAQHSNEVCDQLLTAQSPELTVRSSRSLGAENFLKADPLNLRGKQKGL